MEVMKYVELKYEGGKVVAILDLKKALIPVLEAIKADVESGKIDPVKGTDLDKVALEQAIELVEKYLA